MNVKVKILVARLPAGHEPSIRMGRVAGCDNISLWHDWWCGDNTLATSSHGPHIK